MQELAHLQIFAHFDRDRVWKLREKSEAKTKLEREQLKSCCSFKQDINHYYELQSRMSQIKDTPSAKKVRTTTPTVITHKAPRLYLKEFQFQWGKYRKKRNYMYMYCILNATLSRLMESNFSHTCCLSFYLLSYFSPIKTWPIIKGVAKKWTSRKTSDMKCLRVSKKSTKKCN